LGSLTTCHIVLVGLKVTYDGAIGSYGDVFPMDINGSFFLWGKLFVCGSAA